ncbi:MAG: DHH family phosphoesterase [Candidatus Nomurabacteria bacterium]|nr:DHH family phosphoesterase [Candidatus Saccharibacteria bacterium]USN95522.1 MAG: DHH family phosphoesterase [Candidatus Nomurabacteria bacterium]
MNLKGLKELLSSKKKILIAQADNPDGDSVASALALEQILYDMGNEPLLYCAIDIPKHLRHLPGWDRIDQEIPTNFEATIIVDCSSKSLFEIAEKSGELSWILSKPVIIIDHHDVSPTLDATITCNDIKAVSTGEVVYKIAQELNWPLSIEAKNMIAVSILSDSLGLMTESTTAQSIHIIAELVESGVKLAELEETRRQTMKKSIELTRYKGELLQRIQYSSDDRIATIVIPWEEIEKYSSQFNPSILVLDDMRLTDNVQIAIAFKTYNNNRITAKIRSNYGFPIANKLAEHFGGGGHQYASGFKVNTTDYNQIISECIEYTKKLLDQRKEKTSDETI